MESDKTLIKIAGISYIILGCLFLSLPVFGVLVITAGVFLYIESSQSLDHIYSCRVLMYTIAIIGLFNILGAVLLFVSMSNISASRRTNTTNAPPKSIVDKEARRIDLLLKLGVGMVFISAFLLATTSWDFITNGVKVIFLAVLGLLFICLSIFTEKRYKLYNSSYMYWILGMSLFSFTVVGVLFFKMLGSYLTYSGPGMMLSYSITGLVASILLILTYMKYSKNSVLYLCYIALSLTFYSLLSFYNFSTAINLSLMALILMLLNIVIHKKGTIYFFSKAFSYILFILVLKFQPIVMSELIIVSIIAFINLNYFTLLYSEDEESLLSVLFTYVLIISSINSIMFIGNSIYLIKALMLGLYTLLISDNTIKTKNITKTVSYFIFTFLMISISISCINQGSYNALVNPVFVVFIFGLVNIILKEGLFGALKWKYAIHFETIVLLLLVASLLKTISMQFDIVYILATTSILASMIHVLSKNDYQKRVYSLFMAVILFFAMIMCKEAIHIFASLLIIVSSLYLFVSTYLNYKETFINKFKLVSSYLLLLFSITIPFVFYNILALEIVIPVILVILLSFVLALILGDSCIIKTTYFFIAVPLLSLLGYVDYYSVYTKIIINAISLYMITLLINLFVHGSTVKNISIICIVVLFLLTLLPYPDIYVSLYIGIVGLLMILFTLNRNELTPIFITGIIITILNIIYSLKEIWVLIPFWLYLLVGGLVIIVSVLIKEIRKK